MSSNSNPADTIYTCWLKNDVVDFATNDFWPRSVDEGYASQAALADLFKETAIGWKIAATALAGRQHINVDQPLAGRLFDSLCHRNDAVLSLTGNHMAVAEAEFVFTLGKDLPPRQQYYSEEEVAAAIKWLHPGLELPNSRFVDFTKPGAAGLIADNACAHQFVLGEATTEPFDPASLADQHTSLLINGEVASTGYGRDALDGPLNAMVWIANKLSSLGTGLRAGQFVTTGVTGQPTAIKRGDTVRADLGKFGSVTARLT